MVGGDMVVAVIAVVMAIIVGGDMVVGIVAVVIVRCGGGSR